MGHSIRAVQAVMKNMQGKQHQHAVARASVVLLKIFTPVTHCKPFLYLDPPVWMNPSDVEARRGKAQQHRAQRGKQTVALIKAARRQECSFYIGANMRRREKKQREDPLEGGKADRASERPLTF